MSALLLAMLGAASAWPAFGQPNPLYAWTNFVGQPGGIGNVDGAGNAARFWGPSGVTVDSMGNVFVGDSGNNTIRKVSPTGVVTTLAGSAGVSGTNDGAGSVARFAYPEGVAVDAAGNVFVADSNNRTIRVVTAGGVVTTLAGSAGVSGTNDGAGSAARFNGPSGVAVDTNGNIFVADEFSFTIRQVTAAGVVTTLAGSPGVNGTNDGTGSAARFYEPFGVAVDRTGEVFVADMGNYAIRRMTAVGEVTTLAGGHFGANDGTGSAAQFEDPTGVAVDSTGNVFVADLMNNTIRQVTPTGVTTTLAGSAGASGTSDGPGGAARFNGPNGVAVDHEGNVFVADSYNATIRKVTSAGEVTTLAGAPPASGTNDGTGSVARLWGSAGVAVDSAGNVFVADTSNHAIRKVTPAGVVTTLAGSLGSSGTKDGTGSAAQFYRPCGVAVDTNGNVFVADTSNHTIRQVTSAGVVTTLAGKSRFSGTNDGTGSAARFNEPTGVAVDGAGNVFVADYWNHTIRQVTSAGVVTTLAGRGGAAGTNDGTGSAARFCQPSGVAVDSVGKVFVADSYYSTIRQVTSAGVVTTLAGCAGYAGSADGAGSAARFSQPYGVAVASDGNIFVADSVNYTIRKVTSMGGVTTIGGVAGVEGGADGIGSSANFAYPKGIAVDSAGCLYVADSSNNRLTKGTPIYPWLTAGCDGTHLQLSWPASCLGWELQAQTNLAGAGLGTNWFALAGSTTNTQMSFPLDPAGPGVFYRLRHP